MNNYELIENNILDVDCIINLCGILYENKHGDFFRVHSDLPALLGKLSIKNKINKLIHISALGVSELSDSIYSRSKAIGERKLLEKFPKAKILRPSLLFGKGDNFFGQFSEMSSLSPFLPLISRSTKFQPVFVDDVSQSNNLPFPDFIKIDPATPSSVFPVVILTEPLLPLVCVTFPVPKCIDPELTLPFPLNTLIDPPMFKPSPLEICTPPPSEDTLFPTRNAIWPFCPPFVLNSIVPFPSVMLLPPACTKKEPSLLNDNNDAACVSVFETIKFETRIDDP